MKSTPNPFDVAIAADRRRREHDVSIDTRYGETTRECVCTATRGQSHHEDDSPWLSEAEEDALTPEQRQERRAAYRMHEWAAEHAEGLLAAIPRSQCADHDADDLGEIHWYRDGHQQTITICVPEETP